MVRIRVKPFESRGSYRVNEIAWSETVYRVVSVESGEMGARFGLEGWPEKVVPPKSPRKRSSRAAGAGGAVPPTEATERPPDSPLPFADRVHGAAIFHLGFSF